VTLFSGYKSGTAILGECSEPAACCYTLCCFLLSGKGRKKRTPPLRLFCSSKWDPYYREPR